MVEVFATQILPDDQFLLIRDELLRLVPDSVREKVCAFVRTADSQRSLFGDLMIRRILCERLGIRYPDLLIEAGEKGKPYVAGSPVHFNMSHSGDYVVAAFSARPVGIDIERIRPNKLSVARRFFTEPEFRGIIDQPEDRRLEHFFTLWTLKESYLKAVGKGLTLSLGSFSVKMIQNRYRIEINDTFADVHLEVLPVDSSYTLALCSFEKIISKQVIHLPANGYLSAMILT